MKKILILMTALCLSVAVSAQPSGNGCKKAGSCTSPGKENIMQSEKIAFITRVVDLTPEEAQAFWPVYNQIEKQQKELFKAEHDAYRNLCAAQESGSGDISALLDSYLAAKTSNVNLHVAGVDKYRKILSVEKLARFFTSEELFRRELIGKLRSGKPGGNNAADRRPCDDRRPDNR